MVQVMVRGHLIDIKVGPHGAKPEHDHLVAAANVEGVPVRLLAAEALANYTHTANSDPNERPQLAKSENAGQTRS